MRTRLFVLCLGLFLMAALRSARADTYVRFNTSLGYIDVDLFSSTPNTVANFLSYANGTTATTSYNNSIIHRVATLAADGVGAVQGGGYVIINNSLTSITANAPIASEAGVPNTRGTLAMALTTGPATATTEWFFNTVDNSAALDTSANSGPFTVFGVIANASSLSVMDQISNVPIFNESASFGAAFSELPLLNYTTGNVELQNIVYVNSITVLTVQTFAAWQTANSLPSSSGPAATPLNDGVPNLLKYLCDINPSVPMNATARAKLPTVGKMTGGIMTLTYHQYTALVGVTVNVQTSPDLRIWTTVTNPVFVQTNPNATTGDPIFQVQVPVSGTRQFIRLNVTQP